MGILGIDIGTTGCKATLFTDSGTVIFTSYREYNMIQLGDGLYELDPLFVWDKCKDVILDCTTYSKEPVDGLAVSSFGEAAVYLDKNNNVIRNSILYTDSRGDSEVDKIDSVLGSEYIKKSTGLSLHKMYTLPKLLWIKKNEPQNYKEINYVPLFGDYITYCLTGKRYIDPALASRTMMFNITKNEWDLTILKQFNINIELLSQIKPIGFCIGEIRDDIRNSLKLQSTCKVFVGSHDQVCASIGSMSIKPDSAMLGLGTVSCVTPVFDNDSIELGTLDNYPVVPFTKSLSMTYVVNLSSGAILKWYRDEVALYETKQLLEESDNVYEFLESKIPDEPTDLYVLPHFAGSGTPTMNPKSKGLIYGLRLDTNRYTIYKAIMEGICYELNYNLEYISERNISISNLYATGGGANTRKWCQIFADITGKTIHVLRNKESGNLGLYGIVSTGLSLSDSFMKALENVNTVEYIARPGQYHELYKEKYKKYQKLYLMSMTLEEE